jgi:serine/threonine protein phosphatase PrpC
MVPAEQIAQTLGSLNAQAAADELTRAANHAGGQDNIALVVCRARTA